MKVMTPTKRLEGEVACAKNGEFECVIPREWWRRYYPPVDDDDNNVN